MAIEEGKAAPAFTLTNQDGETVSLKDFAGKDVILYFYPKDDTPGCTTQACGLRDAWDAVTATGVEVFGVSPDSVKSHQKFRDKYELRHPLLSDEGHTVATAFGTWVEKTYLGRTYMGTERTTFVIGPDGRVEHVFPRVKASEHVDRLLDVLA